jgi:hypothetical protein
MNDESELQTLKRLYVETRTVVSEISRLVVEHMGVYPSNPFLTELSTRLDQILVKAPIVDGKPLLELYESRHTLEMQIRSLRSEREYLWRSIRLIRAHLNKYPSKLARKYGYRKAKS